METGAPTRHSLYHGDRPVAELDDQSAVVSRFVYGTRSHVPDVMIQGSTVYRLITDPLATARYVDKGGGGSGVRVRPTLVRSCARDYDLDVARGLTHAPIPTAIDTRGRAMTGDTPPRRVGMHNDRSVWFVAASWESRLSGEGISNAVVLLLSEERRVEPSKHRQLLAEVLRHRPLGLLVAGEGAVDLFGAELDLLSTPEFEPLVMTGIYNEPRRDALDSFLNASWPFEERWDAWDAYTVVGVGCSQASVERDLASLGVRLSSD